jgi:hypothetical protein
MWDRFADVGTMTEGMMYEKYGYMGASLMLQSSVNIATQ